MLFPILSRRPKTASVAPSVREEVGLSAEEGVEALVRMARRNARPAPRESPCRPKELEMAKKLHATHTSGARTLDSLALHLTVLAPSLPFDVWRQIGEEVGDAPPALITTCYAASSEDGRAGIMDYHARQLQLASSRRAVDSRDYLFPSDGTPAELQWRDGLFFESFSPTCNFHSVLSRCGADEVVGLNSLRTNFLDAAPHLHYGLWDSASFVSKAVLLDGRAMSYPGRTRRGCPFLENYDLFEVAIQTHPKAIELAQLPTVPDEETLSRVGKLLIKKPEMLKYLPAAYRETPQLVIPTYVARPELLVDAPPAVKNNGSILDEVARQQHKILQYIDDSFIDVNFLLPIVSADGSAVESLTERAITNDEGELLIDAALPSYPRAAIYYKDKHSNMVQRQAARAGLEADGSMFPFLYEPDLSSIDLARIAAKTFSELPDYIPSIFLRDEKLIDALVGVNGLVIAETSTKHRGSEPIASKAVEQNPAAYAFVREPARSSLSLMRLVSKTWPQAHAFLPSQAFSDEVCLANVLRFDGNALKRAPARLRRHPAWLARACMTTPEAIRLAPKSLRRDIEARASMQPAGSLN